MDGILNIDGYLIKLYMKGQSTSQGTWQWCNCPDCIRKRQLYHLRVCEETFVLKQALVQACNATSSLART